MKPAGRLVPVVNRRLFLLVLAPAVPLCVATGFFLSWPAAGAAGLVVLIMAAGLYFGLAPFLKKRLIEPLAVLETVAWHWRHERFDVRALLPGNDELGRLGESLDDMADQFERLMARMTVKTRTDLVTGLPSRAQLLLDITRTTYPSLLLVNIDSFKEINDSYGNRAGDEILKELATMLSGYSCAHPFKLYKMPADEYALLFDTPLEEPEVVELTGALATRVNEASFSVGDTPLNIHVTCGVSMGRGALTDRDRGAWPYLVAQADMALKKAKKTLRPFLIFHESLEIQREFERSLFWKNAVKQALLEHRIVAFYQPITDNLTGEVQKYETLVRLLGPDNQVHLPADFLEVARRSHFDGAITRAMVNQSFLTFADLPYEFSINLTVRDMLSPEIHQFLQAKIEAHPETAKRLVVEILESEGIENYREVKQFLTGVKVAGVKVAIDDFGSGYSNFDHILRLDVDYIKLDASLVRNIDTDKNAQVIVKTIVGFSRELGLKTISEHVHTREVLEMTISLGVDFSQGFFLGKPGPLDGGMP